MNYYLREGECVAFYDNRSLDKKEILKDWRAIEATEKNGNKARGIRGRHDAQVRTNYMFTVPNQFSNSEILKSTKSMIEKTDIKNCRYTICVHEGKSGEVAQNKHVHLIVNERDMTTNLKNRNIAKKDFLNTFRSLHREQFNLGFGNLEIEKHERYKERLSMTEWKVDPGQAREVQKQIIVMQKTTIGELRSKDLAHVLSAMGAHPDASDRHNWKTADGGRITLTGEKWYDHNSMKGGGGAIDLMMHLKHCSFGQACDYLQALPSAPVIQQTPQSMDRRPQQQATVPAAVPREDVDKIMIVMEYLHYKRHISLDIIEKYVKLDRIFADARGNCVFANKDRSYCELRGTGDVNFHGQAGQKKLLSFGDAKQGKAIFVEGAIDALSLLTLGFKGIVVSTGGQNVERAIEGARYLQNTYPGIRIFSGFDNDQAGDAMAQKFCASVPGAVRQIPETGKDWNEHLTALRALQRTNEVKKVVEQPKVLLKPLGAKKRGGHDFGMGM